MRGSPGRRQMMRRGSPRSWSRSVIITIITGSASEWAITTITTSGTTITTTTIITAATEFFSKRRPFGRPLLLFSFSCLGCAQQMSICAVEHRVGARGPCRIGSEVRAAAVNSPTAHFALGGFFLVHDGEREVGLYRQNQNLQHRLAGPKNMRAAFRRRFE